jgi:hypothetical protein
MTEVPVESTEEIRRVDYMSEVSENACGCPQQTVRSPVPNKWACGAAGSALPWHGRGRRFDPDQVHHFQSLKAATNFRGTCRGTTSRITPR